MNRNVEFLRRKLIVHRGLYNKNNPENSIGSFKKTILKGYPIELDVHLLNDGEVVVFHDDNLNRMTGIDKEIKYLNKKNLNSLCLNNTSYTIPTLKMVLDLIDGRVPVIIEIKYDNKVGKLEKKLVEILDSYNGEFAIQSFRLSSVMWFRFNKPEYIRGLLISSKYKKVLDNYYICDMLCKTDFISCDCKLNKSKMIEKIRSKKIVLGWTIRNKDEYNSCKNYFDNLICENIENLRGEDDD